MRSHLSFVLMCGLGAGTAFAEEPELPPGVPADWWSEVRAGLEAAEYEASEIEQSPFGRAPDGRVLQAPNRANDLRTYFLDEGIQILPRSEPEPAWSLGMAFTGIGRGTDWIAPEAATPRANGNRVEYQRGSIVEWYVNETDGLEQGFDLATRPAGPIGEPLRIQLTLSGPLHPIVDDAGREVAFSMTDGATVVELSKLIAWDRTRRPLPTRFELEGDTLSLVVDDEKALYPIVVDPLASASNWSVSPTGSNFYATTAGDVNGDGLSDLILSSPNYENTVDVPSGRVWVYHAKKNGTGLNTNWTWTGSVNQFAAWFGSAVSTAGDVNGDGYSDILIGIRSADGDDGQEGKVRLYYGSSAGLKSSPAWIGEGNQSGSYYGTAVSTAGDVNGDGYSDFVVGASSYGNGRVFIYYGSATGPVAGPELTPSGNVGFGTAVSTAGDVNGDGFSDVIAGSKVGPVRVYHGSAAGLSTAPDWEGTNIQSAGDDVCTAGDVNGDGYSDVIFSKSDYDGSENNQGRVFVFHGSASGLGGQSDWKFTGVQEDEYLGSTVSTAGDVNGDGYADVLVGSVGYDSFQGRVLLFLGSRDGVLPAPAWERTGGATNSVGLDVSTAGDVNGDGRSDIVFCGQGSKVWVYHGRTLATQPEAGWSKDIGEAKAAFGYAVASAGDVDGDGYSDVIVGAPDHDGGAVDGGKVWIYGGSADGLSTSAMWTYKSVWAGARLGHSVATAGDVNGDGLTDVLVGIPYYKNGQTDEGALALFRTPLSETGDLFQSDQAGARFGLSVSSAGDVNGDGFADVVAGSPDASKQFADEGRVDLWHGSSNSLIESGWRVYGGSADAHLGYSVSSAGDVNGDGFSDVAVGAPNDSTNVEDGGRVALFHGSFASLQAEPAWSRIGDQAGAQLGYSVSSAGDVNGDGFSDVIFGEWKYDDGEVDEGRATVFLGSATGVKESHHWSITGDVAGAQLGGSVSSAGDVDGDGFSDVIVGAHRFDGDLIKQGRATLYCGSGQGLSVEPAWIGFGESGNDRFGISVSSAGDVNGDGFGDIVVGAHKSSAGANESGSAYLYYGNGGPGRDRRPRQRHEDLSSLIAPLGAPNSGEVRLSATASSPFGRGFVQLEVELKPHGVDFDGKETVLSGWFDSGVTGIAIEELIDASDLLSYHWRARVHWDVLSSPYQRSGPWFSPHGNSHHEADFRQPTCPIAAAATPYGSGLPGGNGVPALSATAPVIGGSFQVTISNGNPNAPGSVLLVGTEPASVASGGGTILTIPVIVVDLPPLDSTGSLTLDAALSNNPATCDIALYLQAIIPDAAAAGYLGVSMTNGLELRFGQ